MFYCDDCAMENEWVISWTKSYGRCEICGRTDTCSDIHHSQVSMKPSELDYKNKDKE